MSLWQFVFDFAIFGIRFGTIQYIGFGILFLVYLVQILKYFLYDRKVAAKKQAKAADKQVRKGIIIENAIEKARESVMVVKKSIMSMKRPLSGEDQSVDQEQIDKLIDERIKKDRGLTVIEEEDYDDRRNVSGSTDKFDTSKIDSR